MAADEETHDNAKEVTDAHPEINPDELDLDLEENDDKDNDADTQAIDPAIAAAFGFSSFGASENVRNLKRKGGWEGSGVSPDSKRAETGHQARGANALPIGMRKAGTRVESVQGDGTGQTVHSEALEQRHGGGSAARNQQHSRDGGELVKVGVVTMSRGELRALAQGVRMPSGDTAYFMPSFIEDPWRV